MGWRRSKVPALLAACAAACAHAGVSGWAPPELSRMDSLFLTAARGEPRFAEARDMAERELLALDTVALRYVVSEHVLSTANRTPRQRHYAERLLVMMADSGRNPWPGAALAQALDATDSELYITRLLYLGSRLADTSFRVSAIPYSRSESEDVRRMAVRVLGVYPHPDHLPLLRDGMEAALGLELHQHLWALGAHGKTAVAENWDVLVPVLNDDWFFNRQQARDLLLLATDSSWSALRRMMPRDPAGSERREWWRLAMEAKGGADFLKREARRMTEEERRFFGVAEP